MIIRAEQIDTFEEAAARRFEDEMVAHSKEFSPRLCKVIGDDQVRLAVRSAIGRASGYGFTYRGPIRLFVEMMFLCGSAFDTDPQYALLGEILRDGGEQMERAQRIHEGHLHYLDTVSGLRALHVQQALRSLLEMARSPLAFSSDFEGDMLRHMHLLFPQKTAYAGEAALRTLIREGREEAREHNFPEGRQTALIVVLKFAFGHGCLDDPLYPWISRTLKDERIVSAGARAARLEKKATTWLEHVVARNEARGRM